MILQMEVEQFIQEIEKKLPKLDGKAYESAKDKIAILNRVSIEFMEYEDLMRKLALQNNDIKCNYLKMQVELKDHKSKIDYLEKELETVKKNING